MAEKVAYRYKSCIWPCLALDHPKQCQFLPSQGQSSSERIFKVLPTCFTLVPSHTCICEVTNQKPWA